MNNHDAIAHLALSPIAYANWHVHSMVMPELPFNIWFNAYLNRGHSPQKGPLFSKQMIAIYTNPASRYPTKYYVDLEEPGWRENLIKVIQQGLGGQPTPVSVVDYRSNLNWENMSLIDLMRRRYFRVIYPQEAQLPMSRLPVQPPLEYTMETMAIIRKWRDLVVKAAAIRVLEGLTSGKSMSELKALLATDQYVRSVVTPIISSEELARMALGSYEVKEGNFIKMTDLIRRVQPGSTLQDLINIVVNEVYPEVKQQMLVNSRPLAKEFKLAPLKFNVDGSPTDPAKKKRLDDLALRIADTASARLRTKLSNPNAKNPVNVLEYVRAIVRSRQHGGLPVELPVQQAVGSQPGELMLSYLERSRIRSEKQQVLLDKVGDHAEREESESESEESGEEEEEPKQTINVNAPPYTPPGFAETVTPTPTPVEVGPPSGYVVPPPEPLESMVIQAPELSSESGSSSGEETSGSESSDAFEEDDVKSDVMPALSLPTNSSVSRKEVDLPLEMPPLRRIDNLSVNQPVVVPSSSISISMSSVGLTQPNVAMPSVVKNDLNNVDSSVSTSSYDTIYTGLPAAGDGGKYVPTPKVPVMFFDGAVAGHSMRPPPAKYTTEVKLKSSEKKTEGKGKKSKKSKKVPPFLATPSLNVKGSPTMYVPTAQATVEIFADRLVDDIVVLNRKLTNPSLDDKPHVFVPPLIPYQTERDFRREMIATYRSYVGYPVKDGTVHCLDDSKRSLANHKVQDNPSLGVKVVYPIE